MSNQFGNKGAGMTWPEYYREGKAALILWAANVRQTRLDEDSCRDKGEFSLDTRRYAWVNERYPSAFKNQTVLAELNTFINFIDDPKHAKLRAAFFTMMSNEAWNLRT